MNLEGKTCGVCNKGKLRAFQDEVVEGVYVDAYKCSEFSHVSYTKEVMKHVESLYKQSSDERHIVKVGSSIAVPIPAEIARLLNLKAREKVFISTQDNKIIIRHSPT